MNDGLLQQIVGRVEGRHEFQRGQQVLLTADPARVHLFDSETGLRLAG